MPSITRWRVVLIVTPVLLSITGVPRVALPAQNVSVATPRPTPTPEIDPAADLALAERLLVVKDDLPVFKRQTNVSSSYPTSWELANNTNAPGIFNDARDAEMKRCLGFDEASITTAKVDGQRFVANTENAVASFAMTAKTTEQARQIATERARSLGSCFEKVHTQTFRDDVRREAQRALQRLSRAVGVGLTLQEVDVASQMSEIPADNLEAHSSVRIGLVSKLTARVAGPPTPAPDATQARLLAINRGPTRGKGATSIYFDVAVMQANRSVVAILFITGTGTNLDIERFVMASVGLHLKGTFVPAG